ncbi:MAG: hypothetical protein L3J39_18730 [Verrucomicrobiales bacterium]|nr:hypothetical protein [Verrucomicrobiales bacterium]
MCKSPPRPKSQGSLFFSLCLLFIGISDNVQATDNDQWSRFRGPNGSGLSQATTIPTTITPAHFLWKTEL